MGKQYVHLSTSFGEEESFRRPIFPADKVSIRQIQDETQVEIIKLLISLTNSKIESLFQRANANRKKEDDLYFEAAQLGKDTVRKFMTRISERAHLSRRYTDHSVRSSCVTVRREQTSATDTLRL